MKILKHFLLAMIIMTNMFVFIELSSAVTGRHPTGVNVNTNGTSTVFITFHNLEINEIPVDAFWCGDVSSTGVVIGVNPCVNGTLFGHLPKQFDLSRIAGGGPVIDSVSEKSHFTNSKGKNNASLPRNLTDVMSIPTAVIRRAYQQAQQGFSSEFFYVRQFSNNGVNTFVTVTCRLAGGGARTPLSLTKVDLDFEGRGYRRAVTLVKQSSVLEKFSAEIEYTGSGLLKGRWEIVMPGEAQPTRFDLLSEASLAPSDRLLQKRYHLVSRFHQFLNPTGKTLIPGPDPKLLPVLEKGLYRILFRIEASSDIEGDSDTTAGFVKTGGVAGFPMPTLRYFVGEETQLKSTKNIPPISLLLPHHNQTVDANQLGFSWFELQNIQEVAVYKIEFYQPDGDKTLIASALKKPGESQYLPSAKTILKLNSMFLWRVLAIDRDGKILSTSQLRKLKIKQ